MFSVDGESIRDRIYDIRKFGKTTQQDMAILLGMKRTTYQRLENAGAFSWNEIELIADHFDASPYFIKYGITDEEIQTLANLINGPTQAREPNYTIFTGFKPSNDDILSMQFFQLPREDRLPLERLFEKLKREQNL